MPRYKKHVHCNASINQFVSTLLYDAKMQKLWLEAVCCNKKEIWKVCVTVIFFHGNFNVAETIKCLKILIYFILKD